MMLTYMIAAAANRIAARAHLFMILDPPAFL